MIGGKLPTRPHTAPNSFRRGRILRAKEDHGSPESQRRQGSPGTGPGGKNRVLKGSNIFNSNLTGGGTPRTRRADAASHEAAESAAGDKPRTVSPRSRRRIREINGMYGTESPRLPGIGPPEQGAAPRGKQRGPSPRRNKGPVGNGISPRAQSNGASGRPYTSPQPNKAGVGGAKVWGTGDSESSTVSASTKGSSPRDRQRQGDQPASPPSSPPHSTEDSCSAREVGMDVLETTQQAELQELQLDLDACRSAAAKAEAEKELAEVQSQVVQQECEMEVKRMARENQILQDELDEMKARFRSIQEEHDKKVRGKDRYIQVLWKAMEVIEPHQIACAKAAVRVESELVP